MRYFRGFCCRGHDTQGVLFPGCRSQIPDSPSHTQQYTGKPSTSSSDRDVSWSSLPGDFLRDQKAIWSFPAQLAKGRNWLPTLAIVGGTAGLIVADPHVMPYFRSHSRNLDDVNDTFDGPITTAQIIILPASLMFVGYARHDSYQVGTALLAGEAYADTAIVDLGIKAITRRKRPSDVVPGQISPTHFLVVVNHPSREAVFHPDTRLVLLRWLLSLPPGITHIAGYRGQFMALRRQSAFRA